MHHRMGSYYESSISSCPSPIPSMSDAGPAFSVSSDASPSINSFHMPKRNGGAMYPNQGNVNSYKPAAPRTTSTSPLPPKVQPRKGILMSPSYPSQMSPPPPPPTSSIPRKPGNLKKSTMIMSQGGTSPIRQTLQRDQLFSTQPRSASKEPALSTRSTGRHFGPTSLSNNNQLVRGRKISSREKTLQQRLKFECDDMRQIHALNKRLASLTIADMSPKLALQRILILYNRGDHR